MTGETTPDSTRLTRHLLAAARSGAGAHRSTSFLLPAAVGLANLFFCVLFEDSIREGSDGHSLSLFLFVQGILIFLFTLSHLAGPSAELLRKSLVMPVKPSDRLAFAVLSAALSPVLWALVLSDVIFLLVLFHRSVASVILVPLLAVLMAADIVALTSLASAAAIRRSRPSTIPAAYGILGILGIVTGALLFRMPALPGTVPPASWTAWGITAAAAGQPGLALLCLTASVVLLVLTGFVGRRLA